MKTPDSPLPHLFQNSRLTSNFPVKFGIPPTSWKFPKTFKEGGYGYFWNYAIHRVMLLDLASK